MDPHTGKVYDLSDPDIPPEVRERLIPLDEETKELLEMSEAVDALKKVDFERYRVVPNRAERRAASKKSRTKQNKTRHG